MAYIIIKTVSYNYLSAKINAQQAYDKLLFFKTKNREVFLQTRSLLVNKIRFAFMVQNMTSSMVDEIRNIHCVINRALKNNKLERVNWKKFIKFSGVNEAYFHDDVPLSDLDKYIVRKPTKSSTSYSSLAGVL